MSDTLRRWKDATEDIRGDFEDLRRVIRGEDEYHEGADDDNQYRRHSGQCGSGTVK